MVSSEDEKEAGAVVASAEEDGDTREIKKKVEIQEKIVETTGGHRFSTVELIIIALLAIIIGFIVALLVPRLLERFRGPREPDVFYQPRYTPWIPPPPMRPPVRKRKKAGADVTPQMIARTPPELRKHNVYIDEMGEAVLASPTVFEVWSIERDEEGKIVDAHRINQGEE